VKDKPTEDFRFMIRLCDTWDIITECDHNRRLVYITFQVRTCARVLVRTLHSVETDKLLVSTAVMDLAVCQHDMALSVTGDGMDRYAAVTTLADRGIGLAAKRKPAHSNGMRSYVYRSTSSCVFNNEKGMQLPLVIRSRNQTQVPTEC